MYNLPDGFVLVKCCDRSLATKPTQAAVTMACINIQQIRGCRLFSSEANLVSCRLSCPVERA